MDKKFEGFRVWKIKDNGIPEEFISGTKEEFNASMDKLKEISSWEDTYAIRIGKNGLK